MFVAVIFVMGILYKLYIEIQAYKSHRNNTIGPVIEPPPPPPFPLPLSPFPPSPIYQAPYQSCCTQRKKLDWLDGVLDK